MHAGCVIPRRAVQLSTDGNLLFPAWERLKEVRYLCEDFLQEAAKRAMQTDPGITRVQLGKSRTDGVERSEWGRFAEVERLAFLCAKVKKARTADPRNGQYLVTNREMLEQLEQNAPTVTKDWRQSIAQNPPEAGRDLS